MLGLQYSSTNTKDTVSHVHRAKCSKCGVYLSNWEKHEFTEFVQVYDEKTEKYTDKFTATCVCEHKWTAAGADAFRLKAALEKAATPDWEVSAVRVKDVNAITWDVDITVPKNVNLILENTLDEDKTLARTEVITVEKGGHVEGTLGNNAIVVDKSSDHVDATVTTEDALNKAVENASKDMNVNVTLDDDITLTSALTFDTNKTNVNIDLNGNELNSTTDVLMLKVADGNNVKQDINVVVKNGTITGARNSDATKGLVNVDSGTLTLENVDIEATNGYGVLMFKDGKLNMTGGSIESKGICLGGNNTITEKAEVVMNGVTMKSSESTAVYVPGKDCKVTLDNCTIEGHQGVEIANGTLSMTNTTIKYSEALTDQKLGSSGSTVGAGALYVKLMTPYITNKDKVTVTLNNVTMRYTGSDENINKHVGIYCGTGMSREANFNGSGYGFNDANITILYNEKAN